ncbi:MAG: dicarboxylate/amino acid:cation symporter [Gemmatimonadetes bacterium]|nr:dicarboxylate/amino acid:cation symporter [Gemmatimonadota bacterium]
MTESTAPARRRAPLHTRILIGLAVGAVAGVTSNLLWAGHPALDRVVDYVAQPVGQVFLRMLFMVVVPLVFTSLTLGVAGLGDLRRLGRVGGRTIAVFLATTTLAATIGLIASNVVQPGAAIDPAVRTALLAEFGGAAEERTAVGAGAFGINTFVNIVPRNPVDAAARGDMLGLIFFSLIFGIALTRIRKDAADAVIRVVDGIGQAVVVMIEFAMRLAPYGVAGLIFAVTARFGFDVLQSLGLYVVAVLAALTFHQFGVIGLLARVLTGIRPGVFFRRARTLMVTAFSTSSSNATLPTTIRTAEQGFGVPREIAGFVLPLGATMNMNGTALFEGMTVLFLAQAFGVDLSLGAQAVVVAMTVLTAIGTAGVPGGSIPLLAMVLVMVGIPAEGIALILGVDRLLDMARTVPNVTGDLLTSLVVARQEGVWTPEMATTAPLPEPTLETAA